MSDGHVDTKLHEAVRFGDIDDVKQALKKELNPNLIGLYQWSPMHEAANNGELDMLKLLLQHEGDPNAPDALQGCTAVHYAAKENYPECLALLLKFGGRCDIPNVDGQMAEHLAVSGCKEIVKKWVREECVGKPKMKAKEQHDGSDIDSITSDGSVAATASPSMGYLHLSFEYDCRRQTLRIRVWQISDILLPPAHTSMIQSIYVKGFLSPDKKKVSKRKTEDVKVYCSEGHDKLSDPKVNKSIKYIFSPCSFKFTKPLEYTNVTKDSVKEKSVQLEVCILQKISRKSFLVAMLNIPLKTAVKKLVREKFPLIPCMNHSIPSSMRVYSANELNVTSSMGTYYSNPDIRNYLSDSCDTVSTRASSDTDLQAVIVKGNAEIPSILINMPEEYISDGDYINQLSAEEQLDNSDAELEDVKVHGFTPREKQKSYCIVDIHEHPDNMKKESGKRSAKTGLYPDPEVSIRRNGRKAHTIIELPERRISSLINYSDANKKVSVRRKASGDNSVKETSLNIDDHENMIIAMPKDDRLDKGAAPTKDERSSISMATNVSTEGDGNRSQKSERLPARRKGSYPGTATRI